MRAERAVPALTLLGLAALLGVGIWLLSGTPGSLVNEEPPPLGPTPGSPDDAVLVRVEAGDGASEIGDKLEAAGVIQSARHFRVLAALMGLGHDLVPGDYEFERGETALSALRRISQGLTSSLVVTIPEGLRAAEVAQVLERRGVVSAQDFLNALSVTYVAPSLEGEPGPGLEGFLFPATYSFSRGIAPQQVAQQMLDAFDQRYREQIAPLLGDRSLREVVTLASIIEREARVPEERPVIASVFLNRLELGFPLAADPTVQYALGSDPASVQQFGYWKRELTSADLQVASPYNTYVNVGLPPGPIANPGLDSILAALQPADSGYLFFVARPDGSHAFAETIEEHQRNICEINPARPECG